jgi:hypothetical protein
MNLTAKGVKINKDFLDCHPKRLFPRVDKVIPTKREILIIRHINFFSSRALRLNF